jgi:hypothetical protein
VSPSLFPPTGAISIGDDGQDPVDLDIKFGGLMPVAPANPPGGLAIPAAVAPTAVAPATVAPAAVAPAAATADAEAVGANRGVHGRDQATQHHQAIIAGGNIGNPHVFPLGIHGRNPDQVALLAQMNQEVARGIANFNSFLSSADNCCQACHEAVLTSANQHHRAALANGRSTAAIKQLIDWLEI